MTRDFVGYGEHPPVVEWPNGARLAVSLCINYEEGSEWSWDDDRCHENVGEVISTVPAEEPDITIESFFEYGSRVGVWRLLDIVGEHEIPVTFYLCGLACERNPALPKAVIERGHEPCGHGYRWREGFKMSGDEQREDIRKCVETITHLCGQRPVGWLTRHAPNPATRELVAAEGGFIYDSNSYNDDLPFYVPVGPDRRPWLVVPYSMETNDAKCWRGSMLGVYQYEAFLKEAFDRLYLESKSVPKMMSIGLHSRMSGTPARAGVIDRFIKYASKRGVWFARRDEIARWWLEKCPPDRLRGEQWNALIRT
jgi:peptidoglycan/xylan/chitin deacetylase (PgdA/CDA1 family)